MKNPFVSLSTDSKNEYVTSLCSVNRGIISYIPVKGIADDIVGDISVNAALCGYGINLYG